MAARDILAAGGLLNPTARRLVHTAARLDEIAKAIITDHFVNRTDKRGRFRRFPRPKARRHLYANLEGVWMELPHVRREKDLACVSYYKGDYRGPWVGFLRAFAGKVADHVEADPKSNHPLWRGLVKTLRTIQRKGGDNSTPTSVWARHLGRRIVEEEDRQYEKSIGKWAASLSAAAKKRAHKRDEKRASGTRALPRVIKLLSKFPHKVGRSSR